MDTKYQRGSMRMEAVRNEVFKAVKQYKAVVPYWLALDTVISGTTVAGVTLTAGGTTESRFVAPSDVELILTCSFATAISAGIAGDTQEMFEVEMFDARTDRPLQSQPVTLNTGFGTPSFPHYFTFPIIIPPDHMVRAKFKNLITDAPTDVMITLHGVANYNYDPRYLP
jgi:hypothetical protein